MPSEKEFKVNGLNKENPEIFSLIDIIWNNTNFDLLNQIKELFREGELLEIKNLTKLLRKLAIASAERSYFISEIFWELNDLFKSIFLGYFAETANIIFEQINLILETVLNLNWVITNVIRDNEGYKFNEIFGINHNDIGGTVFLEVRNQRLQIYIPPLHFYKKRKIEVLEEINQRNVKFILNRKRILEDRAIEQQWFKVFLKDYNLTENYPNLIKDITKKLKKSKKEKKLAPNEIVDFRGAKIPRFEFEVLKEIELCSTKNFTKGIHIKKDLSEFILEEENITAIRNMKHDEKEKYLKGCAEKRNINSMGFVTENNRISGLTVKNGDTLIIPDSIGQLTALKQLYIEGSEDIPQRQITIKTLPSSIGQLTHLEILVMTYNALDSIPDSIGNLKKLYHLNLEGNGLRKLPKSIGNLKKLKFLNLKYNELLELPKSLNNLKSLITLDMEASFDRNIKNCISLKGLDSLNYLNVSYNNIIEISSIEGLKQLNLINLMNNKTEKIKGLEDYSGHVII